MTWSAAPAPVPGAVQPLPMGWYPSTDGEPRWWNGQAWTGIRLRGGVPGTDWATSEQPGLALAMGFLWLALGGGQLALGLVSPPMRIMGIFFLAMAVLWFVIAASTYRVKRAPAPSTPPVAPDVIRPLPWEQEGPGAGWYPMTAQVTRWWTGTRWSQYTASRLGVYPTFHGPRSYRVVRGISLGVLSLGALALVAGIALAAGAWPEHEWLGWFVLVGGASLLLVGIVLLAVVTRMQRRTLLLPTEPPAGWRG